jgi:Fe-S-cluster-containing dehydrogenase component
MTHGLAMNEVNDEFGFEGDPDESSFARDVDGFLVRIDPPTARDYDADVTIRIDGQPVTVKKAVPLTDAFGQLVYSNGRTVPRYTTIYDAACHLTERIQQWKKAGRPNIEPAFVEPWVRSGNQVPILCHQEHQRPVAVCRICSVLIRRETDKRPPRKLFPACQHRVEEGMIVDTRASGDLIPWRGQEQEAGEVVRQVASLLAELLATDHLPGDQPGAWPKHNQLADLARLLRVPSPRFPRPTLTRQTDDSSPVIAVDHSACILCDRCVRGCNEIRENFVIGRNGKGYTAQIGFDLGVPMGESSCVECGECMISCPTNALTRKRTVEQEPRKAEGVVEGPVSVDELHAPPFRELFAGIPRKFLQWNAGAVVRRILQPRNVLIREGDYGSHAFLLEEGSLSVQIKAPLFHVRNNRSTGWLSRMLGHSEVSAQRHLESRRDGKREPMRSIRTDISGISVTADRPEMQVTAPPGLPDLRLIGEAACLNNYPYGSTVTALVRSNVLEIRRNVLLQMLRVPRTRERLRETFRKDSLEPFLLRLPLFAALGISDSRQRLSRLIASKLQFKQVDPGNPIYDQGQPADDCYLVLVGFVRVAQEQSGEEIVLDYVGPGGIVGDEELLEVARGRKPLRTSSCRAMDHVELVCIPGDAFSEIIGRDKELLEKLNKAAELRKQKRRNQVQQTWVDRPLDDYLDRGLFHAQSLLVLDLDKCTRCDECTKACADTHNGVTRLIREGLRFENFLVATSCRSCMDPTCMLGCPVDAIHRTKDREIVIEDWCIGCGLCAKNCPYGNIHMAEMRQGTRAELPMKATTCDLCRDVSPHGDPSCVYACPHDAAHRMKGRELFKEVAARQKATGAEDKA